MTDRMTREEDWSFASFILDNAEVAVKGQLACLDTATGNVKAGQVLTTLLPLGYFNEDLTGDGVKLVNVRLFREIKLHWWKNDTVNPVLASEIGSSCYIKDAQTVSISTGGSTRSVAGTVLGVSTTYGVLVLMGIGATGATGASGEGLASASVADRTALAAITAANRFDGMLALVMSDNSLWRFNSGSSFTSDENKMIGVTPAAGTGRWVRADKTFIAKLAIGFGTADAAALLTVPTGFALRVVGMPFWDIVTGFAGGSSSAIGLSASAIATTKGDLLGGAAGELAATLVAGIIPGTIGPKYDSLTEIQAFILKAADFLRFDRITSVYTSGAGFICVPVALHQVG